MIYIWLFICDIVSSVVIYINKGDRAPVAEIEWVVVSELISTGELNFRQMLTYNLKTMSKRLRQQELLESLTTEIMKS